MFIAPECLDIVPWIFKCSCEQCRSRWTCTGRCSMSNHKETFIYCLTLSQTSPGFYMPAVQVFWKHCEKGEIACNEQFLLFSQCFFCPFAELSLIFHQIQNFRLQTPLGLQESKICHLGKRLIHVQIQIQHLIMAPSTLTYVSYQHFLFFPTKFSKPSQGRSVFKNIMGKKMKPPPPLFFHNVFCLIHNRNHHLSNI